MYFHIKYQDGTETYVYAASQQAAKASLRGQNVASITHVNRCKLCRNEPVTVHGVLCGSCWQRALEAARSAWSDIPMTDDKREALVLNFFLKV